LPFIQAVSSWQSDSTKGEEMNQKINDETGDVPGWVLITLMTAGLVVLMWSIAGPALKTVFEQALSKVATF
jgi:hypothetical protein